MKITLNNKEVELTAEEVQEIVKQSKEVEEKKIEIKHRYTGEVVYTSSKPTLKEAVEEAVGNDANLRGADLRGADLRGADLYAADLYAADLYEADLMSAKFYGKGGSTKIKKSQLNDFLTALGVIVED